MHTRHMSHEDNHHKHVQSLFHTHSHHDNVGGTEKMVDALTGKGDPGSRVTLLGIIANVSLVVSKFSAGWAFNSAALVADAGHSLSDLLGDFITLFCWRLSRRPPSSQYPHGYGKFETVGTATISLLLIGGALGIGVHSYHLLLKALAQSISSIPPGPMHDVLQALLASHPTSAHSSTHAHGHLQSLDPNAAWFAAASILCKEWLFRITRRVAREENSPVLHANALHHRSDAYTSIVALCAILGNWWMPGLPLDPLGGIIVSALILQQSMFILGGSVKELTDRGVSPETVLALAEAVDPLLSRERQANLKLVDIKDIRAVRAGSRMFIDLLAYVDKNATISDLNRIEDNITELIVAKRRDVQEIRIKFRVVDDKALHGRLSEAQ